MVETAEPVAARGGLLRLIGTFLLAALYGLIAASKMRSIATDLRDQRDARHWFIAIHLASGAMFFGALAIVMIVRHRPVHRGDRVVGWVLPIAVTILMSLLGIPEPRHGSLVLIVPATAITTFGTIATMYALAHLGKNFGVVADVRGLVVSGPYRWVRHPLYFGELCTTFGLMLLVAHPVTVIAFVAAAGLQVIRATVEERSLTAAFPSYAAYAARTPMLVPRVPRRKVLTT